MGVIYWLVFLGLVFLVGLGITVFVEEGKAWGGLVITLSVVSIFLTFLFGGMQSVPVNTTAVPQAFGTVAGAALPPGTHETWKPWLSTTDISETVQTTNFEPGGSVTGTGTCNGELPIRIVDQQKACADMKIQWRVLSPAADSLFREFSGQVPTANYPGDDALMTTITNNVVVRELENVANNDMGDYDPLTDAIKSGGNATKSLFTNFGPDIQRDMQADLAGQVQIMSVTYPNNDYSTAVEAKLSGVQQAQADDVIANEDILVNKAKATALRALGTPSLAQLVAQCITEAGSNAGQCIPGSVSKIALSGAPTGS